MALRPAGAHQTHRFERHLFLALWRQVKITSYAGIAKSKVQLWHQLIWLISGLLLAGDKQWEYITQTALMPVMVVLISLLFSWNSSAALAAETGSGRRQVIEWKENTKSNGQLAAQQITSLNLSDLRNANKDQ